MHAIKNACEYSSTAQQRWRYSIHSKRQRSLTVRSSHSSVQYQFSVHHQYRYH